LTGEEEESDADVGDETRTRRKPNSKAVCSYRQLRILILILSTKIRFMLTTQNGYAAK